MCLQKLLHYAGKTGTRSLAEKMKMGCHQNNSMDDQFPEIHEFMEEMEELPSVNVVDKRGSAVHSVGHDMIGGPGEFNPCRSRHSVASLTFLTEFAPNERKYVKN